MYFGPVFEQFAKQSPVSVMVRATLENALAPEALDALFHEHADRQYERELLFSSIVDLMGLVVAKVQPSLHAAYQAVADTLPVSLPSVYNKLNGLEPAVTAALVHHTAERLRTVIASMGGQRTPWLAGYCVKVLDGNHLAATERRLEVLHECHAGPLPGQSLVVLEPDMMLVTKMIPCEDGHAQERSLTEEIVASVQPGDCWIADRNFCTIALLEGIAARQGFFVIRHHANLPIQSAGTLRHRGRIDTGEVFEQTVTIEAAAGRPRSFRRIELRLEKPTRDGDQQLSILTNVPSKDADAGAVAELYRKRWTLETLFFELTQTLQGEVPTMGYPRAALFCFGIALVCYNVFSVVKTSLRATFGEKKVEQDVSGFYIANEVRAVQFGMSIALDARAWEPFHTMSAEALSAELLCLSKNVRLARFKRHPRGRKKPVPPRIRHRKKPHVSTARLLAEARGKR